MSAGNPSFIVVSRLDLRPFAASRQQRHVAAIDRLRNNIGLVAWPGKHVGHWNHYNLRAVLRKDVRNAQDGEKDECIETAFPIRSHEHRVRE